MTALFDVSDEQEAAEYGVILRQELAELAEQIDKERTFGEIVGNIKRILREENEAYREISLFGAPSECGKDVHRLTEREIDEYLRFVGMNRRQFNNELRDRTSDRYAYFSGLELTDD